MSPQKRKLPPWLKRPWPAGHSFQHTSETLQSLHLETICTNANCPNRGECWGRGTATVLILGNVCTRNCGFCSVATGRPEPPDPTEPARLARMAGQMNIKYLVITSVSRDDLPDGGAGHFRDCINEVRRQCPSMRFEILTPDFRNCQEQALDILKDALPFVFAHNVETVPSLYPVARAGGNYSLSLRLLRLAKGLDGTQTKSSIMLGLGENRRAGGGGPARPAQCGLRPHHDRPVPQACQRFTRCGRVYPTGEIRLVEEPGHGDRLRLGPVCAIRTQLVFCGAGKRPITILQSEHPPQSSTP